MARVQAPSLPIPRQNYKVDVATPAGFYEVELDDLLRHTAQAGAFVTMHLFGKERLQKDKTFSELKWHDEAIRAKWGEIFRDNSALTSSHCINTEKMVALAERAWSTDHAMYRQQLALCTSTTSKAGGDPVTRVRSGAAAQDSPSKRKGERQKRNRGSRSRGTGRSRGRSRGREKKRSCSRF